MKNEERGGRGIIVTREYITNSSAETRAWKCVRVCRGEISRFDRLIFNIYIVYLARCIREIPFSQRNLRGSSRDNCVCRVNIFTSLSSGSPYFPIALDRNTWNRIHSKNTRRVHACVVCTLLCVRIGKNCRRCFLTRNLVNWRKKVHPSVRAFKASMIDTFRSLIYSNWHFIR